ncbi:polycomb group protein ASXL1-like [Leucoraja erinacea]|uniref:polycomb group protein ASXL1-like n=1 Tax=Leucoraja erinaceus TaxID=7782 RepID=UPI002458FB78|nr:polycomb group protein ASXL1-like [Leucoraja erinacea]
MVRCRSGSSNSGGSGTARGPRLPACGTSPLACLNAMLHTNSRADDGMFYRLPGRMGLYTLKKDALLWSKNMPIGDEGYDDGPDLESCDSNEASTTGEENDASPVSDESSSNASCSTETQGKQVSPGKQNSNKSTQQPVKQQPKKKIGVPVMMSKSIPRVVLTPLKVNGEHVESASVFTAKHTDGESSSTSNGSSCTVTSGSTQYNRTEMNKLQCRPSLNRKPGQHFRALRRSNTAGQMKRNRGEEIDVETPGSILVNTNLRALINSRTFASLPLHFQQQLLFLLPEVDRQVGTDGIMRLSSSALNNEFFTSAAQGWKERLAEGEFTPEMQLRLRQEMEKEKKVELWKENFFEDYYGQKLGLSKAESEEQTAVKVEIEKEANSPVLAGPSKQLSPVKKQDERIRKCTRSSKVDLKCRVRRNLIADRKPEVPEQSEKASACTVPSHDTRSQKQHNVEVKVSQAGACVDEDPLGPINNEASPGQPKEVLPNKSALKSKATLLTEKPAETQPQERTKSDVHLELSEVQPAAISKDQVTCLTVKSAALKSQLEHNFSESKEQKRKSSEHGASTSGPEKKPRLEDHQSFRTAIDSFRTEKEQPTREEPKVPPIRIQLSRIKPPWAVKGQPAYQICPRIISSVGPSSRERTGARTLADIKARAQQARAQREAAAAAAAHVTMEGGGRGGGGGDGPACADSPRPIDRKAKVPEQAAAKHQHRAQLQQAGSADEELDKHDTDPDNSAKQGVIIEECLESNLVDAAPGKSEPAADEVQSIGWDGDAEYSMVSSNSPDLLEDVQDQVTVSEVSDALVSDGQSNGDEPATPLEDPLPEPLDLPADSDSTFQEASTNGQCESVVVVSLAKTDGPLLLPCGQPPKPDLGDKTSGTDEPLQKYVFSGTVIAETKNAAIINSMDSPVPEVNAAVSDSLPCNGSESKTNTTDILSINFPSSDTSEQESNGSPVEQTGSLLIHKAPSSTLSSHEEEERGCDELKVNNKLEASALLELSNEPHVAEKQMTSVIVSICSTKDPSHSLAQKLSLEAEKVAACTAPVDAEVCTKEQPVKQEQASAQVGRQSVEADVDVTEEELSSKRQNDSGTDNENSLYYKPEINSPLSDESCVTPTSERMSKDDRAPVCSESGVIVESPDGGKGSKNSDRHQAAHLSVDNQLQKNELLSEGQRQKAEVLHHLNRANSLLNPRSEGPKRAGDPNRPLSSAEVNNPLVTQLLQGSLPLEKVLPQYHSGTKLEITRLLVPHPEIPAVKQERGLNQSTIDHVAQTTDIKSIISGVHSGINKLADYHLHKILSGDFRDLSQKRLEQMKSTVLQSSKHYLHSQMVLDRECKSLDSPVLQEQLNRTPVLTKPVEESGVITQRIVPIPCSYEEGCKELINISSGNAQSNRVHNPPVRSMPETLKQISSSTVSGYYIPNTPTFCKGLESQNTIFGSVIAKACGGLPGRQKLSHGYLHNTVLVQNDGVYRGTEVIKIQSRGSVFENMPAITQTSPDRKLIAMEGVPNVGRDWLPKLHESFKVIKTENMPPCREMNKKQDILGIKDGAYIPFDSKDKLYVGPIKMDCSIGKVMKESGLQFHHSSERSLINSQLSIQQQLYGKLPKLSLSTAGFSHLTNTTVSELSMGPFPVSLAGSMMSLSQKTNFGNHNSAVPAQTFAENSGVSEMTFKCSCRLKAMIMCKGCGAFCHDDCIGPSKLCVSCLVVR